MRVAIDILLFAFLTCLLIFAVIVSGLLVVSVVKALIVVHRKGNKKNENRTD